MHINPSEDIQAIQEKFNEPHHLSLWIRFENEAMKTPQDAAEALETVIKKLREAPGNDVISVISDRNGNKVGRWQLVNYLKGK